MKNIWKSLFVAALFVSCSEQVAEETVAPEVNNGKAIKFEVANNGGRAAFFQGGHGVKFEGGELLSVRHFVGESVEDNKAYAEAEDQFATTDEKNAWLNVYVKRGNYKLVDGEWVFQTGNNYQEVTWVDGDANTICAFMLPASVKSDNRYANAIKRATLSGTQVQAAANDHSHIDDYMIMMADPQKFAAGVQPETVSIQLQNVLSIVEVTLKSDVAKAVKSLALTSKTTPLAVSGGSVVMDATKKVSTGVSPFVVEDGMGVNEVKLTLTEAAEVTAEGAKFYFVVLPGAHAAGDITLTANCTDGTCAEVAMGAVEFKTNKVYRPALTLAAADFKQPSKIELHFDFSTIPVDDNDVAWGARSSFSNLRPHVYRTKNFAAGEDPKERSPKTFKMDGYKGLEFDFSFSDGDTSGYYGTNYHNKSGFFCLITLQGNKGVETETIGLPVREGYKLVRVEGHSKAPQGYWGTYVAITSTNVGIAINKNTMSTNGNGDYGYADEAAEFAAVIAASEDFSTVVGVSEGAMQVSNGKVVKLSLDSSKKPYPWIFTIPNAEKNTRYYISASGPYLCIEHLYLTYERVDE